MSYGALNSFALRAGPTVDYVLELLVVTGEGEIVVCSQESHADLFNNVLGGLGLLAVIVEVRIETATLVQLPPLAPASAIVIGDVTGTPQVRQHVFGFVDVSLLHCLSKMYYFILPRKNSKK